MSETTAERLERERRAYNAAWLVEAIKKRKPLAQSPPCAPLARGTRSLVYFITCRDAVKIGHSINPHARATEFMTGNPYQLCIAGVLDGGFREEQLIHKALIRQSIHCEWFHMDDWLERIICMHSFSYKHVRVAGTRMQRLNNQLTQKFAH